MSEINGGGEGGGVAECAEGAQRDVDPAAVTVLAAPPSSSSSSLSSPSSSFLTSSGLAPVPPITLGTTDVRGLSVAGVREWAVDVVHLNTDDAEKLVAHKIDGEVLFLVTSEQLEKVVGLGPAVKLMAKVNEEKARLDVETGRAADEEILQQPAELARLQGQVAGIPTRMDDPSMLAYWQAMWTANVGDDRILDLGDAKLVNQDGENFGNTKLFVRDCYKHLSGLLMDARAAHKNVVISGTPGVGKTAFRNFFVFHLVQRMKANPTERFTIILHGTPGERSATCSVLTCSATSQLSALRVADVYQYARKDDPNIVYLVDVSKGNSDDMKIFPAGKTVMFTSPNEKAYSEFRKSGLFKSKPLYMPLWKTRELHQAAAMLGIDAESEDFTLKVERFGGVPRAVWDDPDYENSVQDALLKIDWNACTKNLGSMDNTEGVRHRFVYYKVAEHEDGTYDFTEASLYFGTDFLLACAADKYVQTTRDAVNSVMASPWPGVTPGEKGDFLEAVAHRSLCLCTEVDIRRLGHTSTLLYNSTPFGLAPALRAPLEWTWFDDVDEAVRLLNDALTMSKTAYLRPRSDKFPALDAILVTCERKVMLLQVTISERHHITGPQAVETLGTFVGVCETNEIEPSLVFFVPPTQFSTYPRQTLQGELQSTVKQYVISLRSTGAFQPNPPPAGEVPVTSSSSSRTPCAVAAADVENSTLKRKPQGDAEF